MKSLLHAPWIPRNFQYLSSTKPHGPASLCSKDFSNFPPAPGWENPKIYMKFDRECMKIYGKCLQMSGEEWGYIYIYYIIITLYF